MESFRGMIVTYWDKALNLAQLYLRTIYNSLEGQPDFKSQGQGQVKIKNKYPIIILSNISRF